MACGINNCLCYPVWVVWILRSDFNILIYLDLWAIINPGVNHNCIAISGVVKYVRDIAIKTSAAANGNYKSSRLFELNGNGSGGIHNNAICCGGGRIVIGSAPGLNPPAGIRLGGKCYYRTGVINPTRRRNRPVSVNNAGAQLILSNCRDIRVMITSVNLAGVKKNIKWIGSVGMQP